MAFCRNCGAKIEDSKFCGECGTPVVEVSNEEKTDTHTTNTQKETDSYISEAPIKKKGKLKGILIAIVVIVLLAGVLGSGEDTSSEPSTSSSTSVATNEDSVNQSTPNKVTEPVLSPEEYMAECAWYPYEYLARYPEDYKGKKVSFAGEVIQVMEEGNSATYRINVTEDEYGFWTDTILVFYEMNPSSGRILEGDIVNFYGVSTGLYTYESTMGANITIPCVEAEYILVNVI